MEQNSYREADVSSGSPIILYILQFQYRVQNRPSFAPLLNQTDSFHAHPSYFFGTCSNMSSHSTRVFQAFPFPSCFSTKKSRMHCSSLLCIISLGIPILNHKNESCIERLRSNFQVNFFKNSVWIRKTNQMSLFVFFISLLIAAQHVSGNHVPIIRS